MVSSKDRRFLKSTERTLAAFGSDDSLNTDTLFGVFIHAFHDIVQMVHELIVVMAPCGGGGGGVGGGGRVTVVEVVAAVIAAALPWQEGARLGSGLVGTSPLVLFSSDLATSLVISPISSFMVAAQQAGCSPQHIGLQPPTHRIAASNARGCSLKHNRL